MPASLRLLPVMLLLLVSAVACQPGPRPEAAATALAQTAAALLTAASAPTATLEVAPPTATLPPVPTALPQVPTLRPGGQLPATPLLPAGVTATSVLNTGQPAPSATPTLDPNCTNDSTFVRDINVPDGTDFRAGETFTKTWRIRNIGTCTWTTAYALIHIDGPILGARLRVNLLQPVPPGSEIDLSVDFVAPDQPGTYTSQWQLEAPGGQRFGTRPYVQIRVRN